MLEHIYHLDFRLSLLMVFLAWARSRLIFYFLELFISLPRTLFVRGLYPALSLTSIIDILYPIFPITYIPAHIILIIIIIRRSSFQSCIITLSPVALLDLPRTF